MMNNPRANDTGLRSLCSEDILQVVDLHLRTLGAKSGRWFLARAIYPTMLHPASTGFGYVEVRDGKVVGFIVGMLSTAAWRRTLLRTRGLACVILAGMCMRGWASFRHAIRTIGRFVGPSVEATGHLFALSIDGAYQG